MKHFQMALTRADKRVVKVLVCVIMLSLAVACLASCSRGEGLEEEEHAVGIRVKDGGAMEDTVVTIHFTRFEMEAMGTRSAMTRAAVGDVSTRLDVWICSGGEVVADVHQASTDAGFGTVSVRLDKNTSYSLYAVSHKCDAQATMTDGVIAFPDDKVKDSFYASATFTPSESQTVAVTMARCVGQFRISTTDQVPAEVARLVFTLADTPVRIDTSTGLPTHTTERTVTYNNPSLNGDGTLTLSLYALGGTDEPVSTDITARVYNSGGEEILVRQFSAVPLRNGYRTLYQGEFFTSQSMSMSFSTAADWTDSDIVNF